MEEKFGFQKVQVFAVGCPKFYLKDIPYNNRFTYITGQNPDRITKSAAGANPVQECIGEDRGARFN